MVSEEDVNTKPFCNTTLTGLFFLFFLVFFLWLQSFSCGILVPLPGIEPRPFVVKALSHNLWTTKDFPIS